MEIKYWVLVVFTAVMIIFLLGLAVSKHIENTINYNNQYGDCLDVVLYAGTERGCLQHLRDNPVCMNAFETATTYVFAEDFDDELQCRGFLKQKTNCQGNSMILEAMGIRCP